MEDLTPDEIRQINFELSRLTCPNHKKSPTVDYTINEVNYKGCCGVIDKLCEDKVVDVIAEIYVARTFNELGL